VAIFDRVEEMKSDFKISKIESHAKADLAWPHRARSDEKVIDESLSLRRGGAGTKGIKVDELAAKAVNGSIQDIVELHP